MQNINKKHIHKRKSVLWLIVFCFCLNSCLDSGKKEQEKKEKELQKLSHIKKYKDKRVDDAKKQMKDAVDSFISSDKEYIKIAVVDDIIKDKHYLNFFWLTKGNIEVKTLKIRGRYFFFPEEEKVRLKESLRYEKYFQIIGIGDKKASLTKERHGEEPITIDDIEILDF